ncbi:aldo/keto reductase [Streptomyces sp. CFMR 7]|uniref:aldo/keto reductase n=1 Tax=Streptomyces sp. CFMR 7 TaxID=1649184 RepID=UPI0011AAB6EE|nr:aldo/keto reductase [Streptomyces sp. CFMR 7]
MRYTLFGRTGLRVSELALGAMTLGRHESGHTAVRETSGRILDAYLEAGGNFVDTADVYAAGASETVLGELLDGDRRDALVLASKYTCATRPGDVNSGGNHRKNLVQSVEASLRRLRTDRLDVLWVHARDHFTPVEEVMRALDDLVRSGKVLYVGVSDWAAWEIAQASTVAELRGWTPFTGSQLRYSLLERTPERELLPQARAFDQAVFAWSPLARGRLTGRREEAAPDVRDDEAERRARETVRAVVEIAREGGWNPAAVALAWLRGRPGNIVPILGPSRPDHLTEALGCLEVRLDVDAVDRLDTVSRVPLGFPHDFLREDEVRKTVYGDRWAAIEDRRSAHRRTVFGAI